ncbi:hypothetical protein ART_0349 [Arthrobacter sp. PAMC 25486]|uniref:hypothetical protein n=1 Tax=Arthrobacter sp. PAMC 25486 TaxID=1494608 RepID=UPI000535C0D3|nr:hypothetical protein [Arthrobacter sp. PAMC 25486]AIX99947.1 hypothetical protein ART_0349 [Arthrobacter sp. PAMC 25486]
MRTNRCLAAGLGLLAALVVSYAILGPLILNQIHFRTSSSGLNQIRGGDLAALAVVVPVCVVVGVLAWRNHPAAPVLALAPALFAMYTYSQLILGNEYLKLPGNVERYFPLLLAMFLVSAAVVLLGWTQIVPGNLPPMSGRLGRGSGILLVVIAVFVVVGLHLRSLVDAMSEQPAGAAYLDTPVTFWVVKFYDLGIVAPAALCVGVGLLRRYLWARKPAYGILGAYVLLAWSVAGMAFSMLLNGDPDASVAQFGGMAALASAGSVFAYLLYRPLFVMAGSAVHAPVTASGRGREQRSLRRSV